MYKINFEKLWPLIIFTFALAVRFILLGQLQSYPFFYPDIEGLDPFFYHNLAKCLAGGHWPGDKLLYSHPFYPYVISFFYTFLGVDSYFVVFFQLVMGAFSCVLLFFIAKYIFGTPIAIFSSFIAAIYGPMLFYETVLVPNVLSIFLNLSAILMLFNIVRNPSPRRTFLGALLLGCSLMANSGIAPFVLIFIFWLAWFFKAQKKALFMHLTCFVLALILPIALLSLKHYFVEGHFDAFAAHGGINFYIGNNPQANGTFISPLGFSPGADSLSQESANYVQDVLGRKSTASEISRFWYKKAFSYIKNNPAAWLGLLFKKIVLFWNGLEISDVADYYLAQDYSLLLKFNPFNFRLIGAFGLFGMVLALRVYFKRAFILYAAIFGFMVSCALFFVNSRYRLSAVPFLIMFMGFAISRIWQIVKNRNFGLLTVYAVVLTFCLVFVNIKVMAIDTVTPVYNLSVEYAKKRFYDKSIDLSQRLLKVKTKTILSAVHFNLGLCYYRKNMLKEAILEFKETLRINPDDYNSHFNIGIIYYQAKDYQTAIEEFKSAININNKDPMVYYGLGKGYEAQGEFKKALEQYIEVLRLEPQAVGVKNAVEDLAKNISK